MRFVLVMLAAIALPQAASAQSWRLAAYSNQEPQMAYLVDVDSVKREGSSVTFRQQTIYSATTSSRDFDRSVLWRKADCGTFVSHMQDSDFYVRGKFLGNEAGPSEPRAATAGSVLRTMVSAVCGHGNYFSPVISGDPESWVRAKFVSGF